MARKTHTINDENLGQLQLREPSDPADAPTLHRYEAGDDSWPQIGDDHDDYDAGMIAFLQSLLSGEGEAGELSDEEVEALSAD